MSVDKARRVFFALVLPLLACADASPTAAGTNASVPTPAEAPTESAASTPAPPTTTPPLTPRRIASISAFDVLELPPGWAVPSSAQGSSIEIAPPGQRLAVQRDGIYFESKRVADLAEPQAEPEDIEALAIALAAARDPQQPFQQAQLFIDPSLPSGTVMRALATARRAGWFTLTVAVTQSPTTGHATNELSMLPAPPPLPGGMPSGWFEIVVELGDKELRVGKVAVIPGAMPRSGDMRGLGEVTWLKSEPRGPDELERLARRLSDLSEQLRTIDAEETRVVHLSAAPERPYGELIAALPIAESPRCPDRQSDCDRAAVVLRAGPPPLPAIDELVPAGFLPPPR